MGRMLKIEFSRAFRSKLLLISLLIGIGLVVALFIQEIIPLLNTTNYLNNAESDYRNVPTSLFSRWIGGNFFDWEPVAFFLLIPILATLPFADSFFLDSKSGYIKNIFTRTKKSHYFTSKFITVFTVGGLVIIIPMLLSLILTSMVFPSLMPQVTAHNCGAAEMWEDLFYSHPYIYILRYLVIDFIYGGLFATIALAISYFVENRFIVLLTPLLSAIFIESLCSLLGKGYFSPIEFLPPSPSILHVSFLVVLIEAIVIGLVTGGIFFLKGLHDDTF